MSIQLEVRVQEAGCDCYGEWHEGHPGPQLVALFVARQREHLDRPDSTWTVELADGHKAQWRIKVQPNRRISEWCDRRGPQPGVEYPWNDRRSQHGRRKGEWI